MLQLIIDTQNSIRQATGLNATIEQAKQAHRKLREVLIEVQKNIYSPPLDCIKALDNLVRLDQEILEINSKYRTKMQLSMLSIIDRKALWIGQEKLNPDCKKFQFKGELSENALPLPPFAFELLQAHSDLMQANTTKFQQTQVLTFPSIERNDFLIIMEHLAHGQAGKVEDQDLCNLISAADFLGIVPLLNCYTAQLRERVKEMSHSQVIKLISEVGLGKIRLPVLNQVILHAYVENECRYSFNTGYLIRPSLRNVLSEFCQEENITLKDLNATVAKYLPEFIEMLEIYNNFPKLSNKEQCDNIKKLMAEKAPYHKILAAAIVTGWLPPNHDHPAPREYALAASYFRAPHLQRSNLVEMQKNPRFFFEDISRLITTAPHIVNFEQLDRDLTTFITEPPEKLGEKSFQAYHLHSFVCAIRMGKKLEDLQCLDHFTINLLYNGYGLQYPYGQALLEQGLFDRTHIELHTNKAISALRCLYLMDYEGAEKLLNVCITEDCQDEIIAAHFLSKQLPAGHENLRPLTQCFTNKQVIENLTSYSQENPEKVLPKILLADLLARKGDRESAIHYCSAVLNKQDNPAVLALRGRMYAELDRKKLAESDFYALFTSPENNLSASDCTKASVDEALRMLPQLEAHIEAEEFQERHRYLTLLKSILEAHTFETTHEEIQKLQTIQVSGGYLHYLTAYVRQDYDQVIQSNPFKPGSTHPYRALAADALRRKGQLQEADTLLGDKPLEGWCGIVKAALLMDQSPHNHRKARNELKYALRLGCTHYGLNAFAQELKKTVGLI